MDKKSPPWSDIGYSFLISGDGKVYIGRGYNVVGAHTENYNSRGYGVAFIGNFMTANPTSAAVQAFRDLTDVTIAFFCAHDLFSSMSK